MAVKPFLLFNIFIYIGFLSMLYYIFAPNFVVPDSKPVQKQTQEENDSNLLETSEPKPVSQAFSANQTVAVKPEPKDISAVTNYEELNAFLCLKHRPLPKDVKIPKVPKKSCPDKGIVTITPLGRTGNSLWEYSGVMVISWKTSLKPYVTHCLKYSLDLLFDNLEIPTFNEIFHCPFNSSLVVNSLEQYTSSNQSIIFPHFSHLTSLVIPRISEVIKTWSIKQEMKTKAQETLLSLSKSNHTYVAVHVRRTDYLNYLQKIGHPLVSNQFYEKSMKHFRSKYPKCLFVYISDDPTWCFQHFGNLSDVVVPSYNSSSTAEEDMALMAACNHTIFDYGSFADWGAVLTGGDVIYGKSIFGIKMKNWMKIS